MMKDNLLSEVAVEVNAFIEQLDMDTYILIPKDVIEYYENNASRDYKFDYKIGEPLQNQKFKDDTKLVIRDLYLNYICNEQEREEYKKKQLEYEAMSNEEKRKKYNPDDIFKNVSNAVSEEESLVVQNEKDSIFKKFIKKLKNFFNKK